MKFSDIKWVLHTVSCNVCQDVGRISIIEVVADFHVRLMIQF